MAGKLSRSNARGVLKLRWQTTTLLIGSWLLGLALALTHHCYYASLHGKVVSSERHQFWSSRIGTGLALLVKTCFATAFGIACTQMLWERIRHRPVPVKTLDALFGVSVRAWDLLNYRAWMIGPVVVGLAALAW